MKSLNIRFEKTFKDLKEKIDSIPLTAYDRFKILQNLLELKSLFQDKVNKNASNKNN